MAIFNFRAIGPVFIASVGNNSVNIYNDAYTPIDTADMNQINVLGISRGIYYNLLECDDPTGFADFSEGFSGIHKEIVSGIKLKLGGADVGSSNPLPVQSVNATPINRSGSITTGGTAQVAMAALSTRKAYFFQNISSELMWGSFTGTAAPNATGSFPIQPNGIIRSTQVCETTALSIYGATIGKVYTAWEM